ncbi:MAG: HAMP domain-containing protein, partial [Acidobacteria bacterium]|nr:HAMP domain-containing protein [Acidobacteriota bacterium]
VLGSVAYVSLERAGLDDSVRTLQRLSRHEKALALAEATVNGAVLDVSLVSNAATIEASMPTEIAQYMQVCSKAFAALDEFDAGYATLWRAIAHSHVGVQAAPLRAAWLELSQTLSGAAQDLEARRGRLSERRDELTQDYQRHYGAITKKSLFLSLAGIAGFGALAAWFFARLTRDIGNLEGHARSIVRGQRGTQLPVARSDELGHLMHAASPDAGGHLVLLRGGSAAVALRVKANGDRVYEAISTFDAAQQRFVAIPIDLGPATDQVFLILFGTGFRAAGAMNASATIGEEEAEVLYAGLAPGFAGLDQANVRIPRSLLGKGDVSIAFTADNRSANAVTINIR